MSILSSSFGIASFGISFFKISCLSKKSFLTIGSVRASAISFFITSGEIISANLSFLALNVLNPFV